MNEPNHPDDPIRRINRALGLFLLCFGLILFGAIAFTETASGKIANLVAGLIFATIGLLMMRKPRA